MRPCPVCASTDTRSVVELGAVPVFCNVLWPDADAARAADRAEIHIVVCRRCSHLFNAAFDAARTAYTPAYENSLHFSPRFQRFAEGLARRLVDTYGLSGGRIVDVGCGRGDFLRLICELADAEGIGFDRTHDEVEAATELGERVRLVDGFLNADVPRMSVDLLSCRHVMEHLLEPVGFLAELRDWLGEESRATLYLEVPDARYTLEHGGIWDLIYEHHSYFTDVSFRWAVRSAGLEPVRTATAFGGQYLQVDARLAEGGPVAPQEDGLEVARWIARAVVPFAERYRERVDAWSDDLASARAQGLRLALWGSGSKGVTFLNVLDPGDVVSTVVDVNPRKQGRYVAGSGHRVVAPDALEADPPDRVLVPNPLYLDEIRADLSRRGLRVPVVPL